MYNLTTKNGFRILQAIPSRSNAWLVLKNDFSLLVDSGKKKSRNQLLGNLSSVLNNGNSLQYLFLTHTHYDHCQSAKELSERYSCNIIVSDKAVSSIAAGYTKLPRGTNNLTRFLTATAHAFFKNNFSYIPFRADTIISEDCIISSNFPGIKIILTPGHSADSISLIVDDEIAIVGDALFGIFRNQVFPPFADDIPEMLRSWRKLLDTGCTTFLPGHGRAISKELLVKEYNKYSRAQ